MIWGNGTSDNPRNIRLYYSDQNDGLFELEYGGTWNAEANDLQAATVPGSGLAGQAQEDVDPIVQRLFYIDTGRSLGALRGYPGQGLGGEWLTHSLHP